MRNQLEKFKSLFEQVRNLGITMQLPNGKHTQLSENIKVWFADDREITAVYFGEFENELEIAKYTKLNEWGYRVSFRIDRTDEELDELLKIVTNEYNIIELKQ